MKIRVGYNITYEVSRPTPLILMLSLHPSRLPDLLTPHRIDFDPPVSVSDFRDQFDNICTRVVAPPGRFRISCDLVVRDPGTPDEIAPNAVQHPIPELPDEVLMYLLGSRYCETDRLAEVASALFADTEPGWPRVQAICDLVHDHIEFGYQYVRRTASALEAFKARQGVCRDLAHLAIAFCRCMSIPARYCMGYLGDIGVPPADLPMDFSAWFEAYLGGRWYTFDARHNTPRIGRVVIARGRDASDAALSKVFAPCTLSELTVISDEITGA